MSENPPPSAPSHSIRPLLWLATGLGLGYLPKAPGTWGSLLGPLLVWSLGVAGDPGRMAIAGVVCFLIGVPICNVGINHLRSKDPQQVVFDEIAAFFWVFLCVPVNIATALAGFVLFRVFDILKPWPIRRVERFPRGWGVMADDAVAGLIAGALLWGAVKTIG